MKYQQPFVVLEAGAEAGAAVRQWGHVRTFSPWRYMIDGAARELLELPAGRCRPKTICRPATSWSTSMWARSPLTPPFDRTFATTQRVVAVGRKDFDKVRTKGREQQPFEIRLASGETIEARAVIDASGTWSRPNPAGSGGLPAVGEREHSDRVAYGIPMCCCAGALVMRVSAFSSSAAATRPST